MNGEEMIDQFKGPAQVCGMNEDRSREKPVQIGQRPDVVGMTMCTNKGRDV
jgi:hypothetical protein